MTAYQTRPSVLWWELLIDYRTQQGEPIRWLAEGRCNVRQVRRDFKGMAIDRLESVGNGKNGVHEARPVRFPVRSKSVPLVTSLTIFRCTCVS